MDILHKKTKCLGQMAEPIDEQRKERVVFCTYRLLREIIQKFFAKGVQFFYRIFFKAVFLVSNF